MHGSIRTVFDHLIAIVVTEKKTTCQYVSYAHSVANSIRVLKKNYSASRIWPINAFNWPATANNNNNNLRLLRSRQTAQPTMITTTACHAGQQ